MLVQEFCLVFVEYFPRASHANWNPGGGINWKKRVQIVLENSYDFPSSIVKFREI